MGSHWICIKHARIQKLLSERSNFDYVFFLLDEGIDDPNATMNGPSSALQRNAIKMVYRWRADDGPTLNAGSVAFVIFQEIRTSNAKKPYNFLIFRGRGSGPPAPPPPPSESVHNKVTRYRPHFILYMCKSG